jgi:hypothetical protein
LIGVQVLGNRWKPETCLHQFEDIILDSSESRSSSFEKKRKRAFQRISSGLTRAHRRGERLGKMELTLKPGTDVKMMSHFLQVLRKRIEHKLRFRVEYWKTNVVAEGVNPHMHVVYKLFSLSGVSLGGKLGFIPQKWLSDAWCQITHGSFIVYIQRIRNRQVGRLANYMVAQYVTGQHGFSRQSWSWNWVFRGFARDWSLRFSSWYRRDKVKCLSAWALLVSSIPNHFRLGSVQLVLGG